MTGKKLVLIVEDSAILQQIAIRQLRSHSEIELHTASDGWQALQLVQQHHYSLILMDIHLPDIDGWETARRIRAMRNGRDVTILAVSADGRRFESFAAGMNDHIEKPTHYGKLVSQWLAAVEIA
jgi:CheY-like chemotaxis protein